MHYDSSTLYVRPEVEFRSAVIADQVLAQVLEMSPWPGAFPRWFIT